MKNLVFHVGLMKSGTTYLQEILSTNKESLRENGWDYPGKRLNQQHACYSLCGPDIPWVKTQYPAQLGRDLVRSLKSAKGNLILSAEALSTLDAAGVDRFFEIVGKPDKVVFTVRGLFRILPSAWQQYLKGGGRTNFLQFIDKLAEQRRDLCGFWKTYAYGHAIQHWARYAPVEVVIVPAKRKSEHELWHLFQAATGIPDVPGLEVPAERANLSLDIETAHVLRHINKLLPKQSANSDRLRAAYLEKGVFALATKTGGTRIGFPEKAESQVDGWNREEYDLLMKHSSEIHGDGQSLLDVGEMMRSAIRKDANKMAKVVAQQIVALLS
ncbi:MAG TPA: hypothetical protein VE131_03860 [Terriglobales bacterium]|nr:hypothetical protein [Terriglobales bacterium]